MSLELRSNDGGLVVGESIQKIFKQQVMSVIEKTLGLPDCWVRKADIMLDGVLCVSLQR